MKQKHYSNLADMGLKIKPGEEQEHCRHDLMLTASASEVKVLGILILSPANSKSIQIPAQ
jgi:hypothetical protein